MRITGGIFRGRPLKTPADNLIRPTSDKIRQAVFNALFSRFDLNEKIILDACAGTGALGLEALSRGSSRAIFCDLTQAHLNLTRQNAETLKCADQCEFIKMDITKAIARRDIIPPADLCFLDPPYRKDIILPALQSLKIAGWITDDTLIVAESEAEYNLPFPSDFDRIYGDTRIFMFDGKVIGA